MEGHTKNGAPVRVEQVISVGLVGDKNWMQETAIKQEKPTEILRVTGTITEYTTVAAKSNQSRPTTYIKGALEATDLVKSAVYISGQLILPDSGSGYVTAQLAIHAPKPMTVDMVIVLERAVKSIVGYKYAVILHRLDVLGAETPAKE